MTAKYDLKKIDADALGKSSQVVICKNPVFFTISVTELHLLLEGFINVCVWMNPLPFKLNLRRRVNNSWFNTVWSCFKAAVFSFISHHRWRWISQNVSRTWFIMVIQIISNIVIFLKQAFYLCTLILSKIWAVLDYFCEVHPTAFQNDFMSLYFLCN